MINRNNIGKKPQFYLDCNHPVDVSCLSRGNVPLTFSLISIDLHRNQVGKSQMSLGLGPKSSSGHFRGIDHQFHLPSDTKLLLTNSYSENIRNNDFPEVMNLTRNPLKRSGFPGDFEGANSLKTYEKNNFVIASCQRECVCVC